MSVRILQITVVLALILSSTARGITVSDQFNTTHDYSGGAVPAGGIWHGVYNGNNGGLGVNANTTVAGNLTMGTDGVGWEGGGRDDAPMLFRNVDADDFREARVRVSAQSRGNWSVAGIIVRAKAPLDNVTTNDSLATAGALWGMDPIGLGGFGVESHRQNVVNGVEAGEAVVNGMSEMDFQYSRLVHEGVGHYTFFTSSDGVTWVQRNQFTNASLGDGMLEVGLWGGTFAAVAGARASFDWIEIETGPDAPVTTATWNVTGNASWNSPSWMDDTMNVRGVKPDGNVSRAIFGDVMNRTAASTTWTNKNVTVKELQFNSALGYTIGGAGSITLDADTGNALVNVLLGNHEIQTDLILNDNVTATAAAGSSLNINASVFLNGRAFTVAAGSTVILNNGTVAGGSAGAGQLVNEGSLAGLVNLEGDLVQLASGSLAVDVGGAPLQVTGDASLSGILDVALADGFLPSAGAAYPVLTAASITDQGLKLAGADANLFHLVVGANSVSLVAGAIPEPGTASLAVLALAAGAWASARRRAGRNRAPLPAEEYPPQRFRVIFFCALAATVCLPAPKSHAQHPVPPGALLETRRDDFGGATPHAMQHDYTTGNVPAGSIWTDIHNPTNGGGPFPPNNPNGVFAPALFVADGLAFNGDDKAGKLHVEDLNLHPQTSGTTGIGFEGDRNNAPFLFTNVPANRDFDAMVKVDQQTSGQWSWAGIIARVAGPPVGRGDGDGLDPAENYVSVGRFATDVANPAVSSVLRKNIVNGVQVADTNLGAGAGGPLPLWIRLTKIGGQFSHARSTDGITWESFLNNQVINAALNGAGQTIEIGPSFMVFNGANIASGGTADFDFFEIKVYEAGTPTSATWTGGAGVLGSGSWNNGANWQANVPGVVPNQDTINVTFGSSPFAGRSTTIFNNEAVMVKGLTFDSADKYAVSGSGAITMQGDTSASTINVMQGSHEIQVDLNLGNNTTVNAATGAHLAINNQLNFGATNRSLTVSGPGRVDFNSNIDTTAAGLVTVTDGNVGGSGRINGRLTNNGGTVSPGTSVGTLTVEGNFQQAAAGTLNIELGGTAIGQYDRLQVVGGLNAAILAGTLDVSLVNGFTPAVGNTFDVLTSTEFGGIAGSLSLHASDTSSFSLAVVGGNILRLTATSVTTPMLTGDFNNNGVVDAADYVLWRNGGPLMNDPTNGVQPEDYGVWRANFGKANPGIAASLAAAVPEPASCVIMLLTVVGACLVFPSRRS